MHIYPKSGFQNLKWVSELKEGFRTKRGFQNLKWVSNLEPNFESKIEMALFCKLKPKPCRL